MSSDSGEAGRGEADDPGSGGGGGGRWGKTTAICGLITAVAGALAAVVALGQSVLSGGSNDSGGPTTQPGPTTSKSVQPGRRDGSWSCSKDGFTGQIVAAYLENSSGNVAYVGQIHYRIVKGSNSGGNTANVMWIDTGTTPAAVFPEKKGIQDGEWHKFSLGNGYYPDADAGTIEAKFTFTFASSKPGGNPSCQGQARLP